MTPLGEIKAIWDQNPETSRVARRVDFALRANYVQVYGQANVVWVEHRQRVPEWNGTKRADSVAYAAGTTVYDTATGDWWTATTTVLAGESPTSHPAKWDQLRVPYIFAEYLAQSIYAALTNKEQQTPEDFRVQQTAGWPLLLAELDKLERQQGQVRQLQVRR